MPETLQKWILIVTGLVTTVGVAQFALPATYFAQTGLVISGDAAWLFARHWGLMAFVVGLLLLWSAWRHELRCAAVTAALIEKAGLVGLIVGDWSNEAIAGLHTVAWFDGTCVVLYLIILIGLRQAGGRAPAGAP